MKKKILDSIKQVLLDEKAQLLHKTRKIDIDTDGDEIDEIQANLISSIESQLSIRDANKVIRIDNALRKIEDKSYGLCEDCGELISEKRLEINPYFTLCILCAEQQEFEEKKRKI